MITRTQKRGRHMEQIICKSKDKRYEYPVLAGMAFYSAVFQIGTMAGFMPVYWRLLWIIPIAILVDILTQCGKMVLDAQGIHAVVPIRGEVALIPWTAICKCRFRGAARRRLPGCVLWQDPFPVKARKRFRKKSKDSPYTSCGGEVLCDREMQKIFLGLKKPETFMRREVFGCTMTREEYSQVLKWWIAATQQSEEQLGKDDRARMHS